MDWRERLKHAAQNTNVLLINIFGVSGSGKTNLATYIAETLAQEYSNITYMRVEDVSDIKLHTKPNSILILEDFTYLAAKHTKTVDSFLRELMLVRHKLGHACIIIISHYLTSVLPALRLSHVRALTSLTTVSEIKRLKDFFDPTALWDYYALYINNIGSYYALVNVLGKHYIVKPPLTALYARISKNTNPIQRITLLPYGAKVTATHQKT